MPWESTQQTQVFPSLFKDVSTYSQLSFLIWAMLSSWDSSTVIWLTHLIPQPLTSLTSSVLMTFISYLPFLSLISHYSYSHMHPRLLQSYHYLELFPFLKLKLKHFTHCNLPSKSLIQLLPLYYFFNLIITSKYPLFSLNISPSCRHFFGHSCYSCSKSNNK